MKELWETKAKEELPTCCRLVSRRLWKVMNMTHITRHFSNWRLTGDGESGVGDMGATHHTVVTLVLNTTLLDSEVLAISHYTNVILVTVVQFLGSLVPGQRDLRVVDGDLTLKGGHLLLSNSLVADVFFHRDRLQTNTSLMMNTWTIVQMSTNAIHCEFKMCMECCSYSSRKFSLASVIFYKTGVCDIV